MEEREIFSKKCKPLYQYSNDEYTVWKCDAGVKPINTAYFGFEQDTLETLGLSEYNVGSQKLSKRATTLLHGE